MKITQFRQDCYDTLMGAYFIKKDVSENGRLLINTFFAVMLAINEVHFLPTRADRGPRLIRLSGISYLTDIFEKVSADSSYGSMLINQGALPIFLIGDIIGYVEDNSIPESKHTIKALSELRALELRCLERETFLNSKHGNVYKKIDYKLIAFANAQINMYRRFWDSKKNVKVINEVSGRVTMLYGDKISKLQQALRYEWQNNRYNDNYWDIYMIQMKEFFDMTLGLNIFFPDTGFIEDFKTDKDGYIRGSVTRHHLFKEQMEFLATMVREISGSYRFEQGIVPNKQHNTNGVHKSKRADYFRLAEVANARMWHLWEIMKLPRTSSMNTIINEFETATVVINNEVIELWKGFSLENMKEFCKRWESFKKSPQEFYTKKYSGLYYGKGKDGKDAGIFYQLKDLKNYWDGQMSERPDVWYKYTNEYLPARNNMIHFLNEEGWKYPIGYRRWAPYPR